MSVSGSLTAPSEKVDKLLRFLSGKCILCFHMTSSFSKITNPTGVLVSSDIRPYQNLVFYDV